MANFLIVVDPDPTRRDAFLRRAEAEISPLERLVVERRSAGSFGAVWAAGNNAPISVHDSGGSLAIVWGDALPAGEDRRITAEELAAPRKLSPPLCFDGFYAAAMYDSEAGISIGGDLLGLFPLYYATDDEVLLAGSSPELFRLHPLFPTVPDATGVLGLLLGGALFRGRTLLSGVRRLAPGHLLRWTPECGGEEILQYRIPTSRELHDASFAEQVEALDSTWARVVERHSLADSAMGILLSGGRDSRQIAGYLSEGDAAVTALTLGRPTDYEAECADGVARVCGFDSWRVELSDSGLPWAADLQARWEHLATGFASIHMWQAIEPLRDMPPRFFAGYVREIRERPADATGWEEFFAAENRLAVPLRVLREVIRPDAFAVAPEELLLSMRGDYDAGAAAAADRPWRWILSHRARSHAGGVPWRLSLASWPVLPILDREALATLAALPGTCLVGRRAQDVILRTRFPHLARLPLDRNSYDVSPVLPSLRDRLARGVSAGHRAVDRILTPPRRLPERRYYYRVYDFNGPGWRTVRRRAERNRERLERWFRMDVLRDYLPPPEEDVLAEDPIMDSSGRKLLVGLMLWSGRFG